MILLMLSTFFLTHTPSLANQVNHHPTDESCRSEGFDCVLNGECVLDRMVKSGADKNSEYESAINDVLAVPSHYALYPDIFTICPTDRCHY